LFILLFTLFIFTVGYSNAFSLGTQLPIHLAISIVLPFALIFYSKRNIYFNRKIFGKEDVFLLLFLLSVTISSLFNVNDKTINYISAYWVVFILEYFLVKIYIYYMSIVNILKINYYSIIIISIYVIIEVILQGVFSINLQDYVLSEFQYNTLAFNIGSFELYRAYGLSIEPTLLSYHLNTLGLLAIYYTINYNTSKLIKRSVFLIIVANLLTFSIGGWSFIILGMSLSLLVYKYMRVSSVLMSKLIKPIGLIIILLVVSNKYYGSNVDISGFSSKTNVTDENYNASGRLTYISNSLEIMQDSDLFTGIGLGDLSLRGMTSPTNLYVFIFVESGIVSLVLFLLFIIFSIPNTRYVFYDKGYFILLTGIIAGILHFNIISTFYHPSLWILFIISKRILLESHENYTNNKQLR